MKQQRLSFTVEALCRAQGVSRQAYYRWRQRQQGPGRLDKEKVVLELVLDKRHKHPRLGVRKLHYLLRDHFQARGIKLGRDGLFELLGRHGLLVGRKHKHVKTTNSKHPFRRYGNLLSERGLTASHQAWVADITYVHTQRGFRYLALLTDAYSRKIVGYDLSDSLAIEGSMRALKMAIRQLPEGERVIHHSDRGMQYCSHGYTAILKKNAMHISMAEAGNVYENAIAERVNGILKEEYGLDQNFNSDKQAHKVVKQAIYLYNYQRPHLSLGYLTPAQKHQACLPLAA